jgi:hypothetical protein
MSAICCDIALRLEACVSPIEDKGSRSFPRNVGSFSEKLKRYNTDG